MVEDCEDESPEEAFDSSDPESGDEPHGEESVADIPDPEC